MSYDKNNIFARIIRGEIPAKKIFEDEILLAIEDIAPAAPVHVLIMPKNYYTSFDDFAAAQTEPDAVAHFFKAIPIIAAKLGLKEGGYRLITNHGADASQSVPHFHVHLIGGKPLGGLLPGDTHDR